jgi:predicted nucleotidyltransferase
MKYLSSKNSKLIIGFLYTNPDRKYYLRELSRIIGKQAGVLQKAANYLVKEKIILDERLGNLRFLSANKSHPLYEELRAIIFKTLGVEGRLRAALISQKAIKVAFLFGSFAKNTSDAASDIDLCVIGTVGMKEINKIISTEEKQLHREINYLLYSFREFSDKIIRRDPFILDILKGAVFLVGSYEDLIGKS